MKTDLSLRIVLQEPTVGVDFALQKGHGSDYEPVEKQRSTGKDLVFDLSIGIKIGSEADAPSFTGPFVQGPAGEKFLYIDIGTYAGQKETPWSRRLKIPLSGITWQMIEAHELLVADIPGTGKDGGPNCAYVWLRQVGSAWNWRAMTKSTPAKRTRSKKP